MQVHGFKFYRSNKAREYFGIVFAPKAHYQVM